MISALTSRVTSAAATAVRRLPVRSHALAAPPAGSDLLAVPGDGGAPGIGYSVNVLEDLLGLQREQYAQYGPVYWTSAFGSKLVICLGPEAAAEVFSNRDKAFANAGWKPFLDKFFPRGLMLLDFEEHLHHRRIMQAAFTRDRLGDYLTAMNEVVARNVESWGAVRDFRAYDRTKQLTLDVATEVFLGEKLGVEATQLHSAFTATVEGGLAILRFDVPGGRWHRGLAGRRFLEQYIRRQIPSKRSSPGTEMFSVLCEAADENGARFSDDDVVNHMIFMMMAAHDTSTTTLAMMMFYLAKHPEWQERVRAESLALGKSVLDYDDLDHLPSLDLVMREALRLCAPVGMLARETVKDTSVLGHFIPAGTRIGVSVSSYHRMEPWWSEPDRFDPDRFSAERAEDRAHRLSWAPFGAGAHKCIGMFFAGLEVKTVMHQMLLSYTWSVPSKYEPSMGFLTGPYPSDGLPIKLERMFKESAA